MNEVKQNNIDIESVFLISYIICILSLFLTWYKVPLMGTLNPLTFNALDTWQGIFALVIFLGLIGMHHYNKRYAIISALGFTSFLAVYISYIFGAYVINPYKFGLFMYSFTEFLGTGLYVMLISLAFNIYASIVLLKNDKKVMYKALIFGVISGALAIVISILANSVLIS